ncbi:cold-shock protein [Pseudomonas sp. BCA14]|uniref:cold shock domain-containing protein n=1 Tax=unclassified Pseudomonas TaxID=196821 RepID=UPI00106E9F08|nr:MULTISPECIES: cold shock domain-containing protein [unclassified Pseudomonas]TFF13313.1 cold-shock protein [Pseudomonas sp. JMN1]TFF16003.1 cold-shock protein [Pseudomonas sp. BCA17]TFF29939.1 cold-shock protein [Pseudomonas sp. BCA13]TFF30781.1 cold-shock protein [Pseudomonas sp. BCA14]
MQSVAEGTIKVYDLDRGSGLIAPDGEGENVPVDLQGSVGVRLAQGQRVLFERIHRPDGIFATSVKRI